MANLNCLRQAKVISLGLTFTKNMDFSDFFGIQVRPREIRSLRFISGLGPGNDNPSGMSATSMSRWITWSLLVDKSDFIISGRTYNDCIFNDKTTLAKYFWMAYVSSFTSLEMF